MDNFNNESLEDNLQDDEEQKNTQINRLIGNTNEEFKEEHKSVPLTPKFARFRFGGARNAQSNYQ